MSLQDLYKQWHAASSRRKKSNRGKKRPLWHAAKAWHGEGEEDEEEEEGKWWDPPKSSPLWKGDWADWGDHGGHGGGSSSSSSRGRWQAQWVWVQ